MRAERKGMRKRSGISRQRSGDPIEGRIGENDRSSKIGNVEGLKLTAGGPQQENLLGGDGLRRLAESGPYAEGMLLGRRIGPLISPDAELNGT